MSTTAVLLFLVYTAIMLTLLVYISLRGVRATPPGVTVFRGLLPIAENLEALEAPASRPLKVLLAVDGSPCSDRAVQSVAMRPWPSGSEVEIISVIHARAPEIPDPAMMFEAAHVEALDADRLRAPQRVQRARTCLASNSGLTLTSTVAEGNPAEVILDEADRWGADLVVAGSHGYGPVKRRVLGSVSHALALHAACSVEIVRCPHVVV